MSERASERCLHTHALPNGFIYDDYPIYVFFWFMHALRSHTACQVDFKNKARTSEREREKTTNATTTIAARTASVLNSALIHKNESRLLFCCRCCFFFSSPLSFFPLISRCLSFVVVYLMLLWWLYDSFSFLHISFFFSFFIFAFCIRNIMWIVAVMVLCVFFC